MQKKLKAFRINTGINSMFMDTYTDLNINQSDVLELIADARFAEVRQRS
tara:strand:+ start:1345 stop:1491 length:147 start_codon:yes stop_codon:yes gene_type:complete